MTVAVQGRKSADAASLVPIGKAARKIDPTPREISHPLASVRYQSPLRYPGAKSGLAKVISELIVAARQSTEIRQVDLLVEPFAGGAATTLRLLGAGVVERALLADADPMVAAFWQVAASRTKELIARISDEHTTHIAAGGSTALERWDHWRGWSATPGARRSTVELELATKCLFLNRTTFWGSSTAMPAPSGDAPKPRHMASAADSIWQT